MKKYRSKRGTASVVSWLVSLVMILAGVALISTFFLGQNLLGSTATNESDPDGFNVPNLGDTPEGAAGGPEDKTLRITVPGMSRVQDAEVPYAAGDDLESLDAHAAIHLQGTGFPWQSEANVYLAGHRLGYPGSESFLAFFDLNNLEEGDEMFVTDSEGTEYTYRVFRSFVVGPTELSVTEPMQGRNILTLQSCTLPDYSERLIVQGELVETTQT